MSVRARPIGATLLVFLLLAGALLTGWFGLSANGYLVPAAVMLMTALLLWTGRARRYVRGVALVNLTSGALLVLVLAFGGFLGEHKLDVSGVSLLANLATGGPLLAVLAPVILFVLRQGRPAAAASA
ncbi:MAG: hypothetical protein KGL48_02495 [Sphingomonadales bacterium]|nr:hypothetical protein [Sphingomonadales bacterium]MDE2569702.1 hypothetical protein [Sphingomonadales bacterium]